jgi:Fe2+ or Zn2+ uptake regulation protein
MTEILYCEKCGKQTKIETDSPQYIKERKSAWEKEHQNCEKK